MARKVFFSFHFARDSWRVGIIRNAWVVDRGQQSNRIVDHADWETILRRGDAAIKGWIDDQMNGASVLAVLIGRETFTRPWVAYEIRKAHSDGRGIIGVHLSGVKNQQGLIDPPGPDPINNLGLKNALGQSVSYPIYSWVNNDGRQNFGSWVDTAARRAGY